MGKPICRISNWCIHEPTLEKEDAERFKSLYPDLIPVLATGEVINDSAARWPAGSCCRTTPAMRIEPSRLFETRNTIYLLEGPGRTVTRMPGEPEYEVGATIMLISGMAEERDGELHLIESK